MHFVEQNLRNHDLFKKKIITIISRREIKLLTRKVLSKETLKKWLMHFVEREPEKHIQMSRMMAK